MPGIRTPAPVKSVTRIIALRFGAKRALTPEKLPRGTTTRPYRIRIPSSRGGRFFEANITRARKKEVNKTKHLMKLMTDNAYLSIITSPAEWQEAVEALEQSDCSSVRLRVRYRFDGGKRVTVLGELFCA